MKNRIWPSTGRSHQRSNSSRSRDINASQGTLVLHFCHRNNQLDDDKDADDADNGDDAKDISAATAAAAAVNGHDCRDYNGNDAINDDGPEGRRKQLRIGHQEARQVERQRQQRRQWQCTNSNEDD